MVRLQLGLEFRGRINSRINLSAEGFLGDCQRRDGIAEAHVTHHHQIHITAGLLFESGHRTIDKGHLDPAG